MRKPNLNSTTTKIYSQFHSPFTGSRDVGRALLYTSVLTSGLLLVNVSGANAAACAGAIDTTNNSTACIGGSTAVDVIYPAGNVGYIAGNFSLTLVNHDVNSANGVVVSNALIGDRDYSGSADSNVIATGDAITVNSVVGNTTVKLFDTSSATGGNHGISASATSGNVTVTTGAGAITGGSGSAILATTLLTGNVNVNVGGNVTSTGNNGIEASSGFGGGNVTVTTAANTTVQGMGGDGIFATSTSGDVLVNANSIVIGSDNGIYAIVNSSGNVTVNSFADVTGTTFDGIHAFTNSGNTIVDAKGNVTGGQDGIDADTNFGDVTITTAAGKTVEGQGGDGIKANSSIGDIVINANSIVKGSDNGINANANIGSVTVNSFADVTGTTLDGIHASTKTGDVIVDAKGNVTGGQDGIDASTDVGNVTITTAAGKTVEGQGGDGIKANSSIGDIVINANSIVKGSDNGINANANIGSVTVNSFADVTGTTLDGIHASTKTGNVIVDAKGNVTGGQDGIDVQTNINGQVTITTAAGKTVEGQGGDGIKANSSIGNIVIDANSIVKGSGNGINANANIGSVTVNSFADVTGTTLDGIHASTKTGNVIVDAKGNVTGGQDGIDVQTNINGQVTITTAAGKTVEGQGGDGIKANSSIGNIVIDANSIVKGSGNGINANANIGSVTVNSFADVTGTTLDGIHASTKTGDVIVDAKGNVTGGQDGIDASTDAGNVTVTTAAGKTVEGQGGDGIKANSSIGNIVINANSIVKGSDNGIDANVNTAGDVTVNAFANVTGTTLDGIHAFANFGDVIVDAKGNVTGGQDGIDASSNSGNVTITTAAFSGVLGQNGYGINATTASGSVLINNNSLLEGATAGIFARGTTSVIINNTFGIANATVDPVDLAIDAGGAPVTITNGSSIIGRVNTGAFADILTNNNFWHTQGLNDFGALNDTVNNNSVIVAASSSGVATTTTFANLETLNNAGTIVLSDQSLGDNSNLSDVLSISGDYVGLNGLLYGDAFLGAPGSLADKLIVGGNTSGVTFIDGVDTNPGPGAYNPDGIVVVHVNGTTDPSHFVLLNGPIDKGMFFYDLVYDAANKDHELAGLPDREAFETLATVSAAQTIWHETESVWSNRQDIMRDTLHNHKTITAVADPSTPENAPNSLWLSAFGSWTKKTDDATFTHLNKTYTFDTSYNQNDYGIVGGADFGTNVGDNAKLMFGLLGGYTGSNLGFSASNTQVNMSGGTIGAYATLVSDGFFTDLLVKGDFLGLDYNAPSLAPFGTRATSNSRTLGARADAGYRFGDGNMFIEPMLSFAATSTSIDNFSIGGVTVSPGTNSEILVGAGARFGFTSDMMDLSLTARAWDNLSGRNSVSILSAGPAFVASNGGVFEGVFGELNGKVAVNFSETSQVFLGGTYKIGSDASNAAVNGGFNISW